MLSYANIGTTSSTDPELLGFPPIPLYFIPMPLPWINTLQSMLLLLPLNLLPELGPNGENSIHSSPADPPLHIEREMNVWARTRYRCRPWKNYLHMDNIGYVNHHKAPGMLIVHKDRWLTLFPKEEYLVALTRFRNGIPPLHTCKVTSHLGTHWSVVRPSFAPHIIFGYDHMEPDLHEPGPPKGKARPSKKARDRKKHKGSSAHNTSVD